MFYVNGVLSKQKVIVLVVQHPVERNLIVMTNSSAMKRCSQSNQRIIGPHFFENENVTDES